MNEKSAAGDGVRRHNVVLVVEDDAATRHSLGELLASVGLEAIGFATAAGVLSSAADIPLGCILLDIGLPDESGLRVFERLPSLGRALPVILMTGRPELARQARALRPPPVAVLEKPLDADLLLATIEAALDRLPYPDP